MNTEYPTSSVLTNKSIKNLWTPMKMTPF